MNTQFYSTKEVAELLSVDIKTVRRYLKNGSLKGTRIGRDYRIHGDSVARLLSGAPDGPGRSASSEALVTAVINQKGGVGKTTTAHNLAAGLHALGRRVLLIDLDPQAALTASVGIRARDITINVYHVLLLQAAAAEVIRVTPHGLEILPATIDLSGVEVDLANEPLRAYRLKDSIAGLLPDYDHVLIDCPPSLGFLTLNAMVATNRVIVPVQCEYLATRGLVSLQKTIQYAQHPRLNPDLKIDLILPTMYDSRTVHAREVLDELHRTFPGIVFDPPIKGTVRLKEAPVAGLSILDYEPSSDAADAYLKLAKEVDDHA